jgi:hypothetical protein
MFVNLFMNKITSITKAVLLVIILFANVAALYSKTDIEKSPLELSISLKEKPCVGKTFEIVSRLKNTSEQNVFIDTRNIIRYRTEIAYDQTSSDLFKIPKMRAGLGDGFDDKESFQKFLFKLKPGEFYEDKLTINPTDDNFYKPAGRYLLQTGYGQYIDLSSKKLNLFVGKVDSNELNFEITDCKDNTSYSINPPVKRN